MVPRSRVRVLARAGSDHGEAHLLTLPPRAATSHHSSAEVKMTATIIRLERFNVGCRHHANGIRFPHIYRVTGFEFDLMDGEFVPGTTQVETFYTLSAEGEFGVANPEIVPIKALSPESDKGWIIVRQYATEAAAHAYIDCVGDCRPIPYDYSGPMMWQTGEGVFTLMHRPPLPGRPDH